MSVGHGEGEDERGTRNAEGARRWTRRGEAEVEHRLTLFVKLHD